jgi:hypothetical protein
MLLWLFDRFSPYSYTNNRDKYANEAERREFTFTLKVFPHISGFFYYLADFPPRNAFGSV